MQQPDFWYRSNYSIAAHLLWPFSLVYSLVYKIRKTFSKSWQATVPVVCVGNLSVGGTGKTPTAIAIANFFIQKNIDIHFLSRGYGKTLDGPIRVDPSKHTAIEVGDEPLLLAKIAPTWVSADRRAGAELAISDGATALIMDDGFQNTNIHKDISILVIDGEVGFGNGKIFPAGPLRENVENGIRKANAVLIIGDDTKSLRIKIKEFQSTTLKVLHGYLIPELNDINLKGERVVAFAGIGRPEKFFRTVRSLGCIISETTKFNDHHNYTVDEIDNLEQQAKDMNAKLVTTSKDRIRLDKTTAKKVIEIPVILKLKDSSELLGLLKPILPDET